MNKHDLVLEVAEKLGASAKDSSATIDCLIDIMTQHLLDGDEVKIAGFGTFEVKTRAAREGVKPGTTERINIPERKTVTFKAAKNLKENL